MNIISLLMVLRCADVSQVALDTTVSLRRVNNNDMDKKLDYNISFSTFLPLMNNLRNLAYLTAQTGSRIVRAAFFLPKHTSKQIVPAVSMLSNPVSPS
jgi:hypothetical protein